MRGRSHCEALSAALPQIIETDDRALDAISSEFPGVWNVEAWCQPLLYLLDNLPLERDPGRLDCFPVEIRDVYRSYVAVNLALRLSCQETFRDDPDQIARTEWVSRYTALLQAHAHYSRALLRILQEFAERWAE